jgi:hypothetical protein
MSTFIHPPNILSDIVFLADPSVTHWSGKCANRLLSTSGLPLLTKQMKVPWFYYCNIFLTHEAYILLFLLLTKFPAVNDQRLELSSVWALLAAFEDPLQIPLLDSNAAFEGAFVRDVDSLSWMGNNTRKLFPMQTGTPECWTFFSTAAYGKRNKVPQVACLLQFTCYNRIKIPSYFSL